MLTLVALLALGSQSATFTQYPDWLRSYLEAASGLTSRTLINEFSDPEPTADLIAISKKLRSQLEAARSKIREGNLAFRFDEKLSVEVLALPNNDRLPIVAAGLGASAYADLADGESVRAVEKLRDALLFLHNLSSIDELSFVRSVSGQVSVLKRAEPHLSGLPLEAARDLASLAESLDQGRLYVVEAIDRACRNGQQSAEQALREGWDLARTSPEGSAEERLLQKLNSMSAEERVRLLPKVIEEVEVLREQWIDQANQPIAVWLSMQTVEPKSVEQAIVSQLVDAPNLVFRRAAERAVRYRILRAYAEVAVYKWKHGKFPERLSEIGQKLAADPLGSGELVYVREFSGCRIYSPGNDKIASITLDKTVR